MQQDVGDPSKTTLRRRRHGARFVIVVLVLHLDLILFSTILFMGEDAPIGSANLGSGSKHLVRTIIAVVLLAACLWFFLRPARRLSIYDLLIIAPPALLFGVIIMSRILT